MFLFGAAWLGGQPREEQQRYANLLANASSWSLTFVPLDITEGAGKIGRTVNQTEPGRDFCYLNSVSATCISRKGVASRLLRTVQALVPQVIGIFDDLVPSPRGATDRPRRGRIQRLEVTHGRRDQSLHGRCSDRGVGVGSGWPS